MTGDMIRSMRPAQIWPCSTRILREEFRQGFLQYLPVGALVGIVVLIELVMVVGSWAISSEAPRLAVQKMPEGITNTEAIGRVMYTDYLLFFQAAGLVLLVAMIGAIVLTLRHKEGVKRQNIAEQVARTKATGMEIRKVKSGQGI